MKSQKIMHIVGARPNFMKVAPIMREMRKYPDRFTQILVHTGQHYDESMSEVFFSDLDLPKPDINLGVGSGTHAYQTAQIMLRFESVLLENRPDWVVVVGDVNSTIACALVCSKLGIRVAHVEAGLRSFDRTMPEEINRILTDQISDVLFTTEESANENLLREGIPKEKIYFVGNVMIDTLVHLLPKTDNRLILKELGLLKSDGQAETRSYMLVTMHRPSNVDNSETLKEIIGTLIELSKHMPVIFPVHPRTRGQIADMDLQTSTSLIFLDPLGYLDFLTLMRHAKLVLTDSGGIQEETTYLGVPCLTVRPNTERPVTISKGTNRLVENDSRQIIEAVKDTMDNLSKGSMRRSIPELWDGRASQRIVEILANLAIGE
ncbi:MAG: UDP-N-acetylglucosamine 2-epimerase (non-hydrolyzing) [Proteobacteria bacterium]|nr:UDP-N-acetylglucosamine 2-epimerase (non-hydrolyzing) [Pseudomonadota bacterium]